MSSKFGKVKQHKKAYSKTGYWKKMVFNKFKAGIIRIRELHQSRKGQKVLDAYNG